MVLQIQSLNITMKRTIVFVHGMWQNAKSWKKWIDYFEQRGYNCVAHSWPLHEGVPAELRKNVPEGLGDLVLDDVVTPIEQYLTTLNEKPIVIGHSVGGLISQILVARNLVNLGVSISPVAPNTMLTLDWPFFKNSLTVTNPFKGDEPFYMTPEVFHSVFANTLNDEQANEAFEETAVHDSRNVLRSCMGPSGHIDLDMPHVPLLLISGQEDQIIPHELVEKNSKAYKGETSEVSYKNFMNRSHFICGEPGWEEVAGHIYNWLEAHKG